MGLWFYTSVILHTVALMKKQNTIIKELGILKMGTIVALEKLIWMSSKNNLEGYYELFEDKKAIKFIDSYSGDEKLIKRIRGKYYQLANWSV